MTVPAARSPKDASMIAVLTIGLELHAPQILNAAAKNGYISHKEIAAMVPKVVAHDPERLAKLIGNLRAVLKLLGVVIVTEELRQKLGGDQFKPVVVTSEREVPERPKRGRSRKERAPTVEIEEEKKQEVPKAAKETVAEEYEDEEESQWVAFYDRDLVSLYLQDIGRYRLLRDDEVKALSQRVLASGDIEARNKLVVHNLRLAAKVARGYTNPFSQRKGLHYLDFVQAGNVGLIRAAELYDHRFGARFSTYAHWWVVQRIHRELQDQGGIVRVPVHAHEWWRKVARLIDKFMVRFGREPSPQELAAALDVPVEAVEKALLDMRAVPDYLGPVIQLDRMHGAEDPEDADDPHAIIPSTFELTPDQLLQAREELRRACQRLKLLVKLLELSSLARRDVEFFKLRYGLDGTFEKRTLEAIGERYKITRERVRQIVDLRVWPKLKQLGFRKNEAWLEREFERIRLLEQLTGESARV